MEVLLAGLLEHLVPILITIVSGVLLTLVRGVVKKYGVRLDMETQARAEAVLTDLVQQGVTFAEQYAKNEVKKGIMTGGQTKMMKALEYVASELERNKLPQLAERVMTNKIESALGFGTLNENHGEPPVLVGEPIEDDNDEDDSTIGS